MRRAVILITLTILLIAVAGVTAARENTFTAAPQDEDRTESTSLESTAPEFTTPESTTPEATVPEDPEEPDEGAVENTVENTFETTVVEPEEPEEPAQEEPVQKESIQEEFAPDGRDPDGIRNDGGNEEAGSTADKPDKPEKVKGGQRNGKLRDTGRPDRPVKPSGNGKPDRFRPDMGKPEDAGEAQERGSADNPGKVTLCHKDKVTISVGAPAEPAHLRHGDTLGACG